MKAKLLIFALAFGPRAAFAAPYFRPIDPAAPQIGARLLLDPRAIKNSAGVSDIALVTHSTADGSIIPGAWRGIIAPEDWTPLEIGGGGSFSGNGIIDAGASANIAPQLAGILAKVGCSGAACLAIQSVMNSNYAKSGLGFSAGPAWAAQIVQNGTLLPVDKWQGLFRLSVGASWKF